MTDKPTPRLTKRSVIKILERPGTKERLESGEWKLRKWLVVTERPDGSIARRRDAYSFTIGKIVINSMKDWNAYNDSPTGFMRLALEEIHD